MHIYTDSSFLHLTESKVHIWDVSGFKPVQSVKVSSLVLAVDVWSHYLAIGSSVVQMVDMSSDEWRRIIFVEDREGIPVCRHLQHIIYHNFVMQVFTFPSLHAVLVMYLFTVTLRALHCPHTLLHLLVRTVTWPQLGLTALW